nr:MAG TPA: hypothetical protein [Caudoviricetes sp.]
MFGSDISCAYNVSIMCYSPPFLRRPHYRVTY